MGLSFNLSFGKFDSNHYSVPFQPSVAFKCPHNLPVFFFLFFFFVVLFYWCVVCARVCVRACPYIKALRSFSPCHASPRDRTQVVRHGSKCPCNTIIYIILAFLKLWMTNCTISHFQNTVESFCLSLLKHSFCKNIQLCLITSFHYFRSVPREA